MIKSSKKKRNERNLRLNEESKENELTDYIRNQKDVIEDLKNELNDYKAKYEDRQKDTELLHKLYENGFIDADGNSRQQRIALTLFDKLRQSWFNFQQKHLHILSLIWSLFLVKSVNYVRLWKEM